MQLLKSKTAGLGAPGVKGRAWCQGRGLGRRKMVPALHFGDTEKDDNFTLVDEVQKKMGGTATFFVRSGNDFLRVATNVTKDDGSRGIGTVLDPKGKAMAAISKDQGYYYDDVFILGKLHIAGYEPIHDASNDVVGVCHVGYPQN
jgi:hypothetical protein